MAYKNKICGIYKITSPNGKVYIGQSVNIKHRLVCYKNLQCKNQLKIYNSIKKYGWEKHKFDILQECKREELDKLEKYYIELYRCFNSVNGLNLKAGGNNGGICSIETKIKISQKAIGRKASIETKEKMRKIRLGKQSTSKGKKWTPDSKKKFSILRTGKRMNGTPIINIKTGIVYPSKIFAAKSESIKTGTLKQKLLGTRNNDTFFRYYKDTIDFLPVIFYEEILISKIHSPLSAINL